MLWREPLASGPPSWAPRLWGHLCAAAAAAMLMGACSSGNGGSPTAPGNAAVVTINIVSSSGAGAYTPSPAKVATGADVLLKNYTHDLHHIVMNDGSTDFGEIPAGGSTTRRLTTSGGDYHCTIHATMVGSINGQQPQEPRACDPAFYDLSFCCGGFYC
jgi:plastocyanin